MFDEDSMPVPCAWCSKWVELTDAIHRDDCEKCEGMGSCDDLICQTCDDKYEPMIAYCVRCREKSTMWKVEYVTMKNGRKAAKGECMDCGCGMYKILKKVEA